MLTLLVLEKPESWNLSLPGVELVAAQDYLIDPKYYEAKRAKVFNLCRSYRYQSVGYYVSLLASARGHRPLPSVSTLQDLREGALLPIVSDEIDEHIQRAFRELKTDVFELSIYFGHNTAKRYDRLARVLFNHFPAPLLRAEFRRKDTWQIHSLRPISSDSIPPNHHDFVVEQAARYFDRPLTSNTATSHRYDLGILVDLEEAEAPSNEKAIAKFIRSARHRGIRSTLLKREDFGRLAEFDALFIRETTSVNHHTYRFARKAAAERMVVIDDPESIVRCTNKVYLAELFKKHEIPAPKSWVVHPQNISSVEKEVSYPCVVKRPDSSFSMGVSKAGNVEELRTELAGVFRRSELAVVQEFVRSEFDWRIGLIDGRALYGCRYHYPKGDWRIQSTNDEGKTRYGRVETLPIEEVPQGAVDVALRAANLVGNGLYGVDIKQCEDTFIVIEINDNPSIDAGYEDKVLKDELYDAIIDVFCQRLDARGGKEA